MMAPSPASRAYPPAETPAAACAAAQPAPAGQGRGGKGILPLETLTDVTPAQEILTDDTPTQETLNDETPSQDTLAQTGKPVNPR